MGKFSRFTIRLPDEETDSLDQWIDRSEFEPERSGFRGNNHRAQFFRHLIEEHGGSEDEE